MTLDMSSAFALARIEDHGNHTFSGEEWWQESALFTMCDNVNGVIGYYRIGVHPFLKKSNAYYWTTAQSLKLDDKQFTPGMPIPIGNVNNTTVGELTFQTIKPMEEYRLVVDRPNYHMEVTWKPFFWPIMVHTAVTGASIAAGHYNAIGHASGYVEVDGQRVEINADGYMDHSWGERKNHFPASKWVLAIIDSETFVQVFPVMGVTGGSKHAIGYACADGKLRRLTDDFDTGFSIRDDWLTPTSCDARFVDEDGRTFHLKGRTLGPESIYPFLHGKFCVHALAEFELNGHVARGLLENSPPRVLLPTYVERYGLDERGMWLKPPGEIAAGIGATSRSISVATDH